MNKNNNNKKLSDIPIEDRAEEALKKAVSKVIAENKRLGIPVAIWREGKVVLLPPEELAVKEPKAKYRVPGKRKR